MATNAIVDSGEVLGTVPQGSSSVAPSTYGSDANTATSAVNSYKSKLEQAGYVQKTTADAQGGAFSWVEGIITPNMFASSDSCLIAIVPAVSTNFNGAESYNLVGMISDFSFSQQNHVVTMKEYRAERNVIIPQKAQPGQLGLTRLLGDFPSILALAQKKNTWCMDLQTRDNKALFGILISFYTYKRDKKITSLYFERCAVNSISVSVQAGQFQLTEALSFVFDRVIDEDSKAQAEAVGGGDSYTLGTGEDETDTSSTSDSNSSSGSSRLPNNNNATDELREGMKTNMGLDDNYFLRVQRTQNSSGEYAGFENTLAWCYNRKALLERLDNYANMDEYRYVTQFIKQYTELVKPYLRVIYGTGCEARALTTAENNSLKSYKSDLNRLVNAAKTKGYGFP